MEAFFGMNSSTSTASGLVLVEEFTNIKSGVKTTRKDYTFGIVAIKAVNAPLSYVFLPGMECSLGNTNWQMSNNMRSGQFQLLGSSTTAEIIRTYA